MIKHPENISSAVDYEYLFLLMKHIDIKQAVINKPEISWLYNIVFQNKYYDVKKQIRDHYSCSSIFHNSMVITSLEDHFKFGINRLRLRRYIFAALDKRIG